MKINYTWKHLDHSAAAEEYANTKLQHITKYVHKIISCEVIFEMVHDTIHANLNLQADNSTFNAQNSNKDIYACINELEGIIKHQLSKFHDKRSNH